MTENEAIDELNNLHYKIVHSSFCSMFYESEIEALCMAKDVLQEIQHHRAIGTVEEFKSLKEKSVAKKPIDKMMYLECPTCGDVEILDCGYCSVCGQKLDRQ